MFGLVILQWRTWTSWPLKSSATRLFVQQIIHASNRVNTKAPYQWFSVRWIAFQCHAIRHYDTVNFLQNTYPREPYNIKGVFLVPNLLCFTETGILSCGRKFVTGCTTICQNDNFHCRANDENLVKMTIFPFQCWYIHAIFVIVLLCAMPRYIGPCYKGTQRYETLSLRIYSCTYFQRRSTHRVRKATMHRTRDQSYSSLSM